MQSKATTVEQYLSELSEDRRAAIAVVRHVILKNLDKDYEEGMQYGMIGYYVPHSLYPAGYHANPKQPLPFACLASQKDYMSLYLMTAYGEKVEDKWFRDEWAKTGKKLDMGKSCIRFRHLEELALNVIGDAIRRAPAKRYIEHYEAIIKPPSMKVSKTAKPAATNPAPAAKPASKSKSKPVAVKATKVVKVAKKATTNQVVKKVAKKATAKKVVKKSGTAKTVKKLVKKKVAKKR